MGPGNKQGALLFSVLCTRLDAQLYQRCQDAKGGMGKSEKAFCRHYHSQKVEVQGAQQHPRGDMSVLDYTSKIIEICDSLGSNVTVEEDEIVQICLGGLAQQYGSFRTTICTRKKPPSFDLQSMLIVEENHAGAMTSAPIDSQMLFIKAGQPRGHSWRGGSAHRNGGRNE